MRGNRMFTGRLPAHGAAGAAAGTVPGREERVQPGGDLREREGVRVRVFPKKGSISIGKTAAEKNDFPKRERHQ